MISICDSLNYITEEAELEEVFRLVNNYLDPEGVFIFDFNTVYKYREILGDQTIAESREDCSFIWDNYYYEEEQINEYELSLFLQEEGNLYRKYVETHYQKGYELETVKRLTGEIRHEVYHCIRCIYKESTDKRKRASLCDRKGIWKVQGIDQRQIRNRKQ